jgi:hypothetical protein
MKRLTFIALTAVGLGILAVSFLLGRADAAKRAQAAASIPLPVGHETRSPEGVLSDGWVVPDAPAPFATAFKNLQTFTGPAIGANNGVTQDFEFAQLLYVPTSAREQQIEFQDLGRQHALLRGLQLSPDAEPDPMVQRLVLDAAQTGYDPRVLFGRVITPVLCDNQTPKRCEQYTDKQLIAWTIGDVQAHREPLACLLNQQCSRALYPNQPQDPAVSRILPLAAGGAMLLLAFFIVLHARLRDAGFMGSSEFHGV